MASDRDAHMADVLAFKCVHAVPEGRPCAAFSGRSGGASGSICPFMVHTNSNADPFAKPDCAEVTSQMWLKEIQWYREQEAKHGKV